MSHGKRDGQTLHDPQELCRQPPRQQEIKVPAQGAAFVGQGFDARRHFLGQTSLIGVHWTHIDSDASHTQSMQALHVLQGDVIIQVHHTSAALNTDHLHGVEHALVVPRVGAGLHKHEACEPQVLCQLQILLQRCQGRCVSQIRAIGVLLGGPKDVKVRVTGQGGRSEQGLFREIKSRGMEIN